MNKVLVAVLAFQLTVLFCNADVQILTGIYQGKDLYVKNPVTESGVGFCVFEVLVNGKMTSDELNSAAFAIDMVALGLSTGDPVEVVIRCKEDCGAKVINPEVLLPASTFVIEKLNLNSDGMFTWSTLNETGSLNYTVEQFKWGRWVKVGNLPGLGRKTLNQYAFKADMHSGMNTLRVSQIDFKGSHVSDEVKANSKIQSVSLITSKTKSLLEFSAETEYEIYSEFGELVGSGYGRTVDVNRYFRGKYYVSFDNKSGLVFLKK